VWYEPYGCGTRGLQREWALHGKLFRVAFGTATHDDASSGFACSAPRPYVACSPVDVRALPCITRSMLHSQDHSTIGSLLLHSSSLLDSSVGSFNRDGSLRTIIFQRWDYTLYRKRKVFFLLASVI
jgi:hypothetical protein